MFCRDTVLQAAKHASQAVTAQHGTVPGADFPAHKPPHVFVHADIVLFHHVARERKDCLAGIKAHFLRSRAHRFGQPFQPLRPILLGRNDTEFSTSKQVRFQSTQNGKIMPVVNLYSKRQKSLRGEVPEVFAYHFLPPGLRRQIISITNDCFPNESIYVTYEKIYPVKLFRNILIREYGKPDLGYSHEVNKDFTKFILGEGDVERVLNAIELIFKYVNTESREENLYIQTHANIRPDAAIEELNTRFKEHGVGYQFVSNEIIRMDLTYAHAEITLPTLSILADPVFAGANDEYLTAHEHYRHGRHKECLNECLKAFESTIKIILIQKQWPFDPNRDTLNKLVGICFEQNLIPDYLQTQFSSLRSVLESGVNTIRNRNGGHGQGSQPQSVSGEMARYALNLTGSNIIFLTELSGKHQSG